MSGLLLDTHALYWLASGEIDMLDDALLAIGESQETSSLFVSPISAWELAIATRKSNVAGRPNLGSEQPGRWFRDAVRATAARIIPIKARISCEAAQVAVDTGHKDPGDCMLIATARIRRIPLVTRDETIRAIAADNANYLDVIVC